MELIIACVDKSAEQVVTVDRVEQSQLVVSELNALELAQVGGGVVNVAF